MLARQEIGGEQADGGGERRGEGGDFHGREERAPRAAREEQAARRLLDAEGFRIVLQRRCIIAPHGFDETADRDDAVDDEGEDRPGDRRRIRGDGNAVRQRLRQTRITFAGDGGVGLLADGDLLDEKSDEREHQQHQRQHGGAALIGRGTDDGEKNLCRENFEIAAEHERIAEIRHALDEAEKKGVGDARPHQRQSDGGENRRRFCAQGLRGFLE